MSTILKRGDKAPNFTLKSSNQKQISLFDYKEKVVILFFPLAFSSVCTKELCKVRDNMKFYKALDATVLGISVDSMYTLQAFKKAENINFKLLSDFNKKVSASYGVLNDNFYGMHGVSKRAVFVISADKTIEHTEVLDDAGQLPDFKAVQQALLG